MKSNVVVATHHKTGTVWMATVFKAIAKGLKATYVDFWSHYGVLDQRLAPPFILFNHDSLFLQHEDVLSRSDVRVLHLIRDPRDVLISGMHYHGTATEDWLHAPEPGSGGTTYQQRLNALATPHERYLFELDNASGATLEAMLDWHYERPNCIEVRYEDLRVDESLETWSRILSFLGFEEGEQALCRDAFWNHSLFGRLARANRVHIRSGDVAQWKTEFTPELAQAFLDRFPEVLQVTGYETDDSWVEHLGDPAWAGEPGDRGVSAR